MVRGVSSEELDRRTVDALLTTTRAVRDRLVFDVAVDEDVVLECVELALQAPIGSGRERGRWVVVTDDELKRQVADVYRAAGEDRFRRTAEKAEDPRRRRLYQSATRLAENLHRVGAIVIPCVEGRVDGQGNAVAAGFYGSILPAVWSFQLALRSRGLGSCWTSVHLKQEARMAQVLGIPSTYTQVALIPVAPTVGDRFAAAARRPLRETVALNGFGAAAAQS